MRGEREKMRENEKVKSGGDREHEGRKEEERESKREGGKGVRTIKRKKKGREMIDV